MSQGETSPPSYQTKTTPRPAPGGLGRGLFASADIQAGEDVLHIQSPFVAVLDTQRLQDTCSGCFGRRQLEAEAETALKGCTGCQVVKYCDRTCQAKDWKFAHSLECGIFQKLMPRVLPSNARAVLRMVLRSGKKKYTTQDLDLFLQLETHISEIREESPSQWERIALSSKAVKAYSGTDMKEETISAFGAKLDLNAFNLTNALYDRIGLYLHPYAALINHSCDNNAIVGFDGNALFIKALRPIPKNDQIFISYIDVTNPTYRRKKELRERYFFDCRCLKCTRDDKKPTVEPSPVERDAYAILESVSGSGSGSSSSLRGKTVGLDQLGSTMRLLRRDSWEITQQPLVSLRDELIALLLEEGRLKSAFAHAAIRYLRVDPLVYASEGHPVRCLHAWALAKIAMHLSQGMMGVEEEGSGSVSSVELERFGVDFTLIVWSVLGELVGREEGSCTVPGFRGMVRKAFAEVHGEFLRGGLDPRGMKEEIRGEWEKVGEVVRVVLDRGL